MKKSQLLKQQRATKLKEMDALLPGEGQTMTDEARTKFDALEAEVKNLDSDIKRNENLEARTADMSWTQGGNPADAGEQREIDNIKKRYSILKAVRNEMQGRKQEGIEAEMHQEAMKESRGLPGAGMGFGVPIMFRADLAVASTGANLVPIEQRGFIGALQPRLVTEELGCTLLTGLTGNVELPGVDAAGSATWEGENDDAADAGSTMRKVSLSPNRLAAYQNVSLQLIMQESVSAEAEVRRLIERAIANKVDIAMLYDGPASDGSGIISASTNVVAIGTNGGALTWAKVVEMETAVATENADLNTLHYVFTTGLRGKLKVTEKISGQNGFIWDNNLVNGYSAVASNHLPKTLTKGSGSSLHAAIFGDFTNAIIAQWGGVFITVDSNSSDMTKKGLVNITANSYWDVALRHAKAFAVVKDASI